MADVKPVPARPSPKAKVVETEELVGDKLFVFDEGTGVTHELNSGAAIIWFLCDGERDLKAIASELVREYKLSMAQALADVQRAVSEFQALGILDN